MKTPCASKTTLGRKIQLTLICFMLTMAADSAAFELFDDRREGFTFTFGAGPGYFFHSQDSGGINLNSGSTWVGKPGVATLSRVGWGFGPGYEAFLSFQNSLFPMKRLDGERKPYAAGNLYLGLLKYQGASISDTIWSRHPYLSLGIGLGTFGKLWDTEGEDSRYGLGAVAGAGYDLTPSLMIDGSLYWGNPGRSSGGVDISTQSMGFRLTICIKHN